MTSYIFYNLGGLWTRKKLKNQVCLIWLKLCTKQSYCGLLKISEICHLHKYGTTITSTKDFEYTPVNRWRHLNIIKIMHTFRRSFHRCIWFEHRFHLRVLSKKDWHNLGSFWQESSFRSNRLWCLEQKQPHRKHVWNNK